MFYNIVVYFFFNDGIFVVVVFCIKLQHRQNMMRVIVKLQTHPICVALKNKQKMQHKISAPIITHTPHFFYTVPYSLHTIITNSTHVSPWPDRHFVCLKKNLATNWFWETKFREVV